MHVSLRSFALLALAFVCAAALCFTVLPGHADAITQNCSLALPANPLSAAGLATPYQLVATDPATGACHEANPLQSAFVQGAIIDTTGKISLYNPLVIDAGSTPALLPLVPTVSPGAIIALWFGFNGNVLTLTGQGKQQARCIDGLGGSHFGQFAYCNASAFFVRARQALRTGILLAPPLGTGLDGKTCPTVRDFSVVDQDQSDNVTTSYLVQADGTIAQNTAANQATLGQAVRLSNGSDEGLLAGAIDPALGCTPWMAPDLANGGALAPSLPLNELSAMAHQGNPVALVPLGDPMVLLNGHQNFVKTALYRYGVDQPLLFSYGDTGSTQAYCRRLYDVAPARLTLDSTLETAKPSPAPAVANTLATFLASRLSTTLGANGLNCTGLLHRANPVTLTVDNNGVVTAATVSLSKKKNA